MTNEEHAIREAEIEPSYSASSEAGENVATNALEKKDRSRFEFFLLLVLGVLVGVTLKQETSKSMVIGFEDYKMKIGDSGYDINALQAEVTKKRQESPEGQGGTRNIFGSGGNCSIR